jgi:hypothetical protein
VLTHTKEVYGGSGVIAVLILSLGNRRWSCGQLHVPAAFHPV